ncbi:MAG TPA: phospholipase [Thermoanaerobaculia bacterium]|nr:phospholipase [Thermoanaerobaculia bacterium]
MEARTIETPVHGRYLVEDRGGERLLMGFHGYAEVAEWHLDELRKIPHVEQWTLVSVQALHPFYTRSGQVVANWMTSLDRELALRDNVEYVRRVLATFAAPRQVAFLGFSQGAAMAMRAAAWSHPHPAGLILLGGDIPPDVKEDASVTLPPVLLARGSRDEWYTDEKFKNDLSYLEARTRVTRCVFAGGHEWSDAFRDAAGEFLKGITG